MTLYEEKFAQFIQMCDSARGKGADRVVVPSPQVLGDNYAEIIESLNRLAASGLALLIVPVEQRAGSGAEE